MCVGLRLALFQIGKFCRNFSLVGCEAQRPENCLAAPVSGHSASVDKRSIAGTLRRAGQRSKYFRRLKANHRLNLVGHYADL